jgi:assimilatory nitrate reductase catalytic subunit
VAVSSVLADGRFFTATGRARLVATEPRLPQHVASERLPFVLNTGRVRDQWHTMTRTGKSSRLAARDVEPFVQIHPADAVRCGLRSGALARLSGDTGCFVARVVITSDVRPGHVFAPMHWSAQYASCGRVGVLIAAATDPVSGQPELKHAPVRLEPYEPSWYGFALSRTPLTTTTDCTYVARAKGRAHWRYELAGETTPASWRDWARSALGHAGHWIELSDPAAGRYRAAHVVEDRLRACLFVARVPALPAREWLAGLFERPLDEAAKASLLAARAADGAVESGPLVCACFSVGRDTLLDAIRTQSLVTTDQIGRTLGAGTNCGSCLPELAALLADTGALHRAAGCASGG